MSQIPVDAAALQTVLNALVGKPHMIRELQATRSLPGNPIDALVQEYNTWADTRSFDLAAPAGTTK